MTLEWRRNGAAVASSRRTDVYTTSFWCHIPPEYRKYGIRPYLRPLCILWPQKRQRRVHTYIHFFNFIYSDCLIQIAESGSSQLSTLMIETPGDLVWDLPCVQQASCLEGGPLLWIWPLYLHVNQKSDDDDDDDVKLKCQNLQILLWWHVESNTVIISNIGTDWFEQTVQTQIRLLCLLFCLHLLNTILHCKIQLFQLQDNYGNYFRCPNF